MASAWRGSSRGAKAGSAAARVAKSIWGTAASPAGAADTSTTDRHRTAPKSMNQNSRGRNVGRRRATKRARRTVWAARPRSPCAKCAVSVVTRHARAATAGTTPSSPASRVPRSHRIRPTKHSPEAQVIDNPRGAGATARGGAEPLRSRVRRERGARQCSRSRRSPVLAHSTHIQECSRW